jgi:hypothetical protein
MESACGFIGEAFSEPHSNHLAALSPFLSADFYFEPIVANLTGAAPLYGHESRSFLMMMEVIHGYLFISLE